jgi:hypothetical protein
MFKAVSEMETMRDKALAAVVKGEEENETKMKESDVETESNAPG